MAKTDGLIWPTGDNGWKKIPTGPGYIPQNFSANSTAVQLRCVKGAGPVAGAPGPIVDFTSPDQLETANPPADGKPVVQWAGVHPTDLRVALIVWSCPVVILDKTKFNTGGNISVNGRVMTVELSDSVDIDGGNPQTVVIHSGGVGGYGTVTDNSNIPAGVIAADTKNDTTDVPADSASPTAGQQIPAFFVNDETTLNVICVYQFEMRDMLHCGGAKNHKAWGICWCLWGSTTPMDLFPFGTFKTVDPANLIPPALQHYAGAVTAFADRGQSVPISVVGTAGPAVTVQACLESGVALQDGEFVGFNDYECDTLCGTPDRTKVIRDEAIPFVDEDIMKPALRTLPLAFFTTATPLKVTSIPLLSTQIFQPFQTTTLFYEAVPFYTSSSLITVIPWNTDIPVIPQGVSAILPNVALGNTPIVCLQPTDPFFTDVISTVDLVVCLPGGTNTTLHLLALPAAGSVTVVTNIFTTTQFGVTGAIDLTYFQPTDTDFTVPSQVVTVPDGISSITPVMLAGATPIVLATPLGSPVAFGVTAPGTQNIFVPDPGGTTKFVALVDTTSPTDDMLQVLTVTNSGKLRKTSTTVTAPGACSTTPEPATVVTSDAGLYEQPTEIVMLKPIIVQKDPGNEQACPCFTGPDGLPEAKPGSTSDGFSSSGNYSPCTVKVRRLQHKRCLTNS